MSNLFNRIKGGVSNPVNDTQKQQIQDIVKENMETYKENYNTAFQDLVKEKSENEESIVFEEVDKEAKKEAGLDTIKENITEIANNEVLPDIVDDLPEQSKGMGQKAAEKAIEKIVDKSVTKIVEKITSDKKKDMKEKDQEKRKQEDNTESQATQKSETELTRSPVKSDQMDIEREEPKSKLLNNLRNIYFQSTIGPSQKQLQITVDIKKPVRVISARLSQEFGLPEGEFLLSHNGRTLEIEDTLTSYNVKNNDTILLIPISTAGAY